MRRVGYFVGGLLLVISAVYLPYRLAGDRDWLILAAVSPFILGAFTYGLMLIIRSIGVDPRSSASV